MDRRTNAPRAVGVVGVRALPIPAIPYPHGPTPYRDRTTGHATPRFIAGCRRLAAEYVSLTPPDGCSFSHMGPPPWPFGLAPARPSKRAQPEDF